MAQYGDYVKHTDLMSEATLREILEGHARQALEDLGKSAAPEFDFNRPFEEYDEETGRTVSGFKSAWKVTV